jgi:hypothetical protein
VYMLFTGRQSDCIVTYCWGATVGTTIHIFFPFKNAAGDGHGQTILQFSTMLPVW